MFTVGAEVDVDRINSLLTQVKGKDITELIASGREKLASVPSGGGAVAVAAPAGGAAGGGAAPAAAEKKEEKVEEKEESDDVSSKPVILRVTHFLFYMVIAWSIYIMTPKFYGSYVLLSFCRTWVSASSIKQLFC